MNLKELFRNARDGSFLLSDTTGFALCPYSHVQNDALMEWTVTHNNNSLLVAVQVFINDELYEPEDIVINSLDQFTIKFSEPVAGRVNFIVQRADINACGVVTVT